MGSISLKPSDPRTQVSLLLDQLGSEDKGAEQELMALIYGDLRRLARHHLRSERPGHTLQPTALVHEAYLKLVCGEQVAWHGKAHFFATASRLMRHILVDHARSKLAGRRGGERYQVTLTEDLVHAESSVVDILVLNEILEQLTQLDPRQARIVELHFFGGLAFEEIGYLLGISDRTVKRDWSMAKAWLKQELAAKR
jgi:RNA polymerase sigma factor (TIGR02999 family)